jgi:hypothetical protein
MAVMDEPFLHVAVGGAAAHLDGLLGLSGPAVSRSMPSSTVLSWFAFAATRPRTLN